MKALKKDKGDVPNHIAIAATKKTLVSAKIPPDKFFTSRFQAINQLIDAQPKYNVRKLTVFVSKSVEDSEYQTEFLQVLTKFLQDLSKSDKIKQHKIKVIVLGNWQSLPDSVVQSITTIMEETREYSQFQFTICVSYDGKIEILDAVKEIAKEILAKKDTERIDVEKKDADDVMNEEIHAEDADRENVSVKDAVKTVEKISQKDIFESISVEKIDSLLEESSKPNLIIVVDGVKELQGILLWNSSNAKVYFSDKNMADFSVHDLLKAIAHWQKWNKLQK